MARLPVAVIGFGAFGRNHARVYAGLEQVELAAIVDTSPVRQSEARLRYPGVPVGAELPNRPIMAASVAVPTESHRAVALDLMLRGIPCLVEKPIAADLKDAEALLADSERLGVPVYVGQLERYNPVLLAARELIREPRFIEVHRLGSFSPRSLDIDVVLDLMVHDLDIILTLAGAEPERIEAIGVDVLTKKVDICNARLTFASGLVGNVTASRVSKEKVRKLRVFQPDCYLSLDFVKRAYELYRVEPGKDEAARPQVVGGETLADGEEPLKAELGAFVSAVRDGSPPPILASAEEGITVLRLALGIVAAMGRGQG